MHKNVNSLSIGNHRAFLFAPFASSDHFTVIIMMNKGTVKENSNCKYHICAANLKYSKLSLCAPWKNMEEWS